MAIKARFQFLRGDKGRKASPRQGAAGRITPGDVFQRSGRAGLGALGLAVAEKALGRPFGVRIKGHHVPRTDPLA